MVRFPTWALAVLVAVPLVVPPPAGAALPETSLTAADYWSFVDSVQVALDPSWDATAGAYRTGGQLHTRVNAALLLTHATAASLAHVGPSRQDARARTIAAYLVVEPAFRERGAHGPGWTARLDRAGTAEHFSLDPKVAEALAAAYTARTQLELPETLATAIRARIILVARSAFYRKRHVNQINWNSDIYLADAVVSGRPLSQTLYRHWLSWFLRHGRRPIERGIANLTNGYGFRYRPDRPAAKENRISTSEYGSMALGMFLPYDLARGTGMEAIAATHGEMARRWQRRIIYGDWTHAGYLNWDTGIGPLRWHLRRYWALAANGPLAVAVSSRISYSPNMRAEAKYVFDQALRLYERFAEVEGTLIAPASFGVRPPTIERALDPSLTAVRFQALVARAIALDLGLLEVRVPPPMYGFDPEIRRLAVSTPVYSTAIVPPTDIGNGGIELSRLYDGKGQPLSGTGGNGVAKSAFGLRLVAGARTVLETQPGFNRYAARLGGLTTNSPAGGGAFSRLTSSSSVGAGKRRVVVEHVFTPTTIAVSRRIRGGRGLVAEIRFPTWLYATFELRRGADLVELTGDDFVRDAAGATGLRAVLADGRDYDVAFASALPAGSTIQIIEPGNAFSAPLTDTAALVRVPLRASDVTLAYTLTP